MRPSIQKVWGVSGLTERSTCEWKLSFGEYIRFQNDHSCESRTEMPSQMAVEKPHAWVKGLHTNCQFRIYTHPNPPLALSCFLLFHTFLHHSQIVYVFPGSTCLLRRRGKSMSHQFAFHFFLLGALTWMSSEAYTSLQTGLSVLYIIGFGGESLKTPVPLATRQAWVKINYGHQDYWIIILQTLIGFTYIHTIYFRR
jgi:hypothetical protein